MKKLLTISLALLLVIYALTPCFVQVSLAVDDHKTNGHSTKSATLTVNGIEYSINANKATIIGFIPESVPHNIIIPEKVNGCSVTQVASGALKKLGTPEAQFSTTSPGYYVESISMPSVISLDDYALQGCSAKIIDMPKVQYVGKGALSALPRATDLTLKAATKLCSEAFSNCDTLISVELPSIETLEAEAFYSCDSLTSVSLGQRLAQIDSNPFVFCKKLTNITVSANNKNFTAVDGILYNKSKSIIYSAPAVSGLLTLAKSVTQIAEKAFYLNTTITGITMPSVTTIGISAFRDCSSLLLVSAPKLTTIKGSAFREASLSNGLAAPKLTSVNNYAFKDSHISKADFPLLQKAGMEAFQSTKLTEVNLPQLVSIDDGAFSMCQQLKTVTLSDKTTEIGLNPFYGCNKLTSFIVSTGNKCFTGIGGVLYNKNRSVIIAYPSSSGSLSISKLSNRTTEIGPGAFSYSKLTEINLDSVTTVDVSAFSNCNSLTTANMPNVTKLWDSAFNECGKLTTVTMPKVTEICDKAFYNANLSGELNMPNLKTVGNSAFEGGAMDVWDFVIPNVSSVGSSAFSGCENVTIFNLPKVTIINDYAFSSCSSLTSIKHNATVIGEGAFFGCYLLNDIDLSKVTELGEAAFGYCDSIIEVNIENVEEMDTGVFYSCHSLEAVTLGKLNRLAPEAFMDCRRLTTVDIGAVSLIAEAAFINCTSLSDIDLWNIKFIEEGAFKGCNSIKLIDLAHIERIEQNAFTDCNSLTDVYFYCGCPVINGVPFNHGDYAPTLHFVKGANGFSTPSISSSDGFASWDAVEFDPLGDVNSDHVTNTGDVTAILKYNADMILLTDRQLDFADINKDRVVNTADAVALLKYCTQSH